MCDVDDLFVVVGLSHRQSSDTEGIFESIIFISAAEFIESKRSTMDGPKIASRTAIPKRRVIDGRKIGSFL